MAGVHELVSLAAVLCTQSKRSNVNFNYYTSNFFAEKAFPKLNLIAKWLTQAIKYDSGSGASGVRGFSFFFIFFFFFFFSQFSSRALSFTHIRGTHSHSFFVCVRTPLSLSGLENTYSTLHLTSFLAHQ